MVEVMLFLGPGFCSGSGLLARVTRLFLATVGFRAAVLLRYQPAMERFVTLRQKILPEGFLPVRYRVARARGSNPVVKKGGRINIY